MLIENAVKSQFLRTFVLLFIVVANGCLPGQ